ncbi:SRPBCC domain-containing protein [Antrihabitans cavernicola]|uniref:Polyketide cyclase n=1 Tax=Antrihabitans cavernicola TaxID=2495913 RepID=A0A5A7S5U2_9NOCA|nr:SRPBCC domain-containing protein [Spelaeibacter cavernicola]KAA0017374.1 polyketide cyclase [Spelaeibacter cavernicola]
MTTTDTLQITAVSGTQNIEITREFAATPEQLLRAHTDRDLYGRWVGPKGYEMIITEFEPRHGGKYAYIHRNPAGTEFSFRGVFHGDPSVETGVTQTFEYLGVPDVGFGTVTFEDLGNGRTLLRERSVFPSVESRDGIIEAGMEHGVREGYDKLDELLAAGA